MEGTKEIDELMCPVKTAIERHVKDRTAFTDIYNRAYEALMISMDVKDSLRAENERLAAELDRHAQKGKRAAELAIEAVNLGKFQAEEMDRYWAAIGLLSDEITIDDAIARYKAMEAENERLRGLFKQIENHYMILSGRDLRIIVETALCGGDA